MRPVAVIAALIAGGGLVLAALDLLADLHDNSRVAQLRQTAAADAAFRGLDRRQWKQLERKIFGGDSE